MCSLGQFLPVIIHAHAELFDVLISEHLARTVLSA